MTAKVLTNAEQLMAKLPEYKSHKVVWALKIAAIVRRIPNIEKLEKILSTDPAGLNVVGAVITPEDENYAAFEVTDQYVHKHQPQVGGYWVLYEDGYQSWSPAAAFEGGYTRV